MDAKIRRANFGKRNQMKVSKGEYFISTNKSEMDIDIIHGFLTNSYWSAGISKEIIQRSILGSLCFGVFYRGERAPPADRPGLLARKQVGFARMITDGATFAYLADVFIIEEFR